MRATRRRDLRARRSAAVRQPSRRARKGVKPRPVAKPAARPPRVPAAPELVMFRVCRPGWAVIVERSANALGTRFVCPFCPQSHRVPGPVRGFRKLRKAQWVKLRRVSE